MLQLFHAEFGLGSEEAVTKLTKHVLKQGVDFGLYPACLTVSPFGVHVSMPSWWPSTHQRRCLRANSASSWLACFARRQPCLSSSAPHPAGMSLPVVSQATWLFLTSAPNLAPPGPARPGPALLPSPAVHLEAG